MESNITRLTQSLDKGEIETLLRIYYNREGLETDDENVLGLVNKNLVSTKIEDGKSLVDLTEEGISVCGTVMFQRINESQEIFKEKISDLPQRGVASLVNRVMFKNTMIKESGLLDPFHESYSLDESLWFERVLLKDERMTVLLDALYGILESVGLVRNINGQRWCTPEVEEFLQNEYRDVGDLSWMEEDSLRYYYFFYVYAQDQKNIINFAGGGEEYKSMFIGENATPLDYWFSSNRSDPKNFISNLGLNENRIIEFLIEMENMGIVNERMYPLSSFSFFSDEDRIYLIKDIKGFMDFISKKFLGAVVNSLLS